VVEVVVEVEVVAGAVVFLEELCLYEHAVYLNF